MVTVAIDYPEYNYRGSLLTMNVDVHDNGVLDFQYHYKYDDWNRLRDVYANFDSSKANGNQIVHYDYNDALGLLTATEHFQHNEHYDESCADGVAQTIVYSYDVRDRLTDINSDLFDCSLYYDNQVMPNDKYGNAVNYDQNWNGNINGTKAVYNLTGSLIHNPSGPSGTFDDATLYGYKYDNVNRLYEADGTVENRVDTTNLLTYDISNVYYDFDKIGNFKYLKRITGIDTSGSNNVLQSQEWNYKYSAGTNRLVKVIGLNGSAGRVYSYDANGNLGSDNFRDLLEVNYTRANYPRHISKTNNEIDYFYNVGDLRVYKRTETSSDSTEEYYLKSSSGQDLGILDMLTNIWTWYVNGADRVAKVIPTSYQQPDSLSLVGGAVADSNFTNVHYYIYDHLGNTRVVYDPQLRDSTCILEHNIEYAADYYPYGKILRQYSNGEVEKFLTTQHERDLETGLDYRGARFYDSDVARFLSLDPLAADYPSLSDYSYVAGNPVMFIDPTGKSVEDIYSVDDKGNVKLVKETPNLDYDLVYKVDATGKRVEGTVLRVNDQSILKNLVDPLFEKVGGYDGKNVGHYFTSSTSEDEILKVFRHFAQNTKVEWGVSKYNADGKEYSTLGTRKSEGKGPGLMHKSNEKHLVYDMHSHPHRDWDVDKASNGDRDVMDYRVNKFETVYESKPPRQFIYDPTTEKRVEYTPTNSRLNVKNIRSYKDLKVVK